MPRMVSGNRPTVKTALRQMLKKTNDKRLSIRIRILLVNLSGQKTSLNAETAGCSVNTVRPVVNRFVDQGVIGLYDRREENGDLKLDEGYLARLKELVELSPREFGYLRPTPGQNKKRYLAGAVNADTGELVVAKGDRKNSLLFLKLLEKLKRKYAYANRIYVILDNYRIHHSRIINAALAHDLKKLRLSSCHLTAQTKIASIGFVKISLIK